MTLGKQCGVPGCAREYYAKDLCQRHYYRQQRYGDPEGSPAARRGRVPEAFSQHGMTYRQVEHMIAKGYVKPGKLPNGARDWPAKEVAVAVLAHQLHNRGLQLGYAVEVARDYIGRTGAAHKYELMPGVRLLVTAASARKVGKEARKAP